MVPSSPQGPCRSGNTTSTSPSLRGTEDGSLTTSSVPSCWLASATPAREGSTSGSLSADVMASRAGSSDSSTHRPSWVIPTGTTSYRSGSMACRTLPAVTHEIACSLERPPKTTAIRGLRVCWSSLMVAPTLPVPERSSGDGVPRLGGMSADRVDPAAVPPYRPATVAVKAGRPPHEPDNPLNEPLTMASTYVAGGDVEYGRYGNPTWAAFEQALGELEGGRCLAFSSGLAAVATILDLVGNGATVVAPRHAYNGSIMQLADLEARGRVKAVLVDVADTDAVVKACQDAALVWLESPTNPALEVADIPPIVAAAHDAGAYVVVDNTFATPLLQQPLSLDADIVVHSATKFISGHSDVLMGAVVTGDEQLFEVLKKRRDLTGAVPGTFEAWLALRGLRTLHVRLERAQHNAQELARRLHEHPAVGEVRYPGFGAIVSIVLAQGALAADLLTHKTSLWVHATSLGGVESTFERRRRWKSEPATIPEGLVRMSVGIEDVDDLWSDLAAALDDLTGDPRG